MKATWILAMWTLVVATAAPGAQRTVEELDWRKLSAAGRLRGGAPFSMDGRAALVISNGEGILRTTELVRLEQPQVTQTVYAVVGEVRYDGVEGDGYVEMWNVFRPASPAAPETRAFSRTLAQVGPMKKLSGSSGWRSFVLPFNREGAPGPPLRLELNVVLPGRGAVYLGPLRVVEYTGGLSEALQKSGAWWSDRTAGLAGGIGGATIGCLASLMAWFASRGRMRGLVLWVSGGLIGVGALCGVAGLVAISMRQPYAVWFPLMLGAVLLVGISGMRLGQFRKSYQEIEFRRMKALDAGA